MLNEDKIYETYRNRNKKVTDRLTTQNIKPLPLRVASHFITRFLPPDEAHKGDPGTGCQDLCEPYSLDKPPSI